MQNLFFFFFFFFLFFLFFFLCCPNFFLLKNKKLIIKPKKNHQKGECKIIFLMGHFQQSFLCPWLTNSLYFVFFKNISFFFPIYLFFVSDIHLLTPTDNFFKNRQITTINNSSKFDRNSLIGTIPTTVGLMTVCNDLYVFFSFSFFFFSSSSSSSSSYIIQRIFEKKKKKKSTIKDNQITGTLPTEIGLMSELEELFDFLFVPTSSKLFLLSPFF